jgi:hypothetical protein
MARPLKVLALLGIRLIDMDKNKELPNNQQIATGRIKAYRKTFWLLRLWKEDYLKRINQAMHS